MTSFGAEEKCSLQENCKIVQNRRRDLFIRFVSCNETILTCGSVLQMNNHVTANVLH